jgi:hypothetical protein
VAVQMQRSLDAGHSSSAAPSNKLRGGSLWMGIQTGEADRRVCEQALPWRDCGLELRASGGVPEYGAPFPTCDVVSPFRRQNSRKHEAATSRFEQTTKFKLITAL